MKEKYLERTIGLLGEKGYDAIKDKCVAIFGLGGVGGTALEALMRSGISNFVIVDFDVVDPSNLNRQILYKEKDIGKIKVNCACEHIKSIDDSIKLTSFNKKVNEESIKEIFTHKIDFIVDAMMIFKEKKLFQKCPKT